MRASAPSRRFPRSPPQRWDEVHDVNLKGCFFAAQKALPLLADGGAIVFTGSIGSVLAVPGNVIYAAAKAGLRAAARIFAVELLPRRIRVNMVSPGPTETPADQPQRGDESRCGECAARTDDRGNTPMRRMGEPEEVARAVLFLSSRRGQLHHRCRSVRGWRSGGALDGPAR